MPATEPLAQQALSPPKQPEEAESKPAKPAKPPNPVLSEIEPGLFLGDNQSSYYLPTLEENKINAMVSMGDVRMGLWRAPPNRELVSEDRHLFIPSLDTSTQLLLDKMVTYCDFIEENRKDGGIVLVHCMMGISRSATVMVAYLMRKYKKSVDDALAMVKKHRRVRQNPNFMEQLRVWGETQYQVFEDADGAAPKPTYAAYLAGRAKRLSAKGLTGDEPTCDITRDNW